MFTETVQDALGPMLELTWAMDEDPAVAVIAPPQFVVRFDGVATTTPAGRLSVKAIPFTVKLALGFVTVKDRLVAPFRGIVAAPNALTIVGALITVRLADAVFPLPASVELMVTLLLKTPSVVPCTFTVIEQVPTGKAALVKLIVAVPAVAVTVPPQLLT